MRPLLLRMGIGRFAISGQREWTFLSWHAGAVGFSRRSHCYKAWGAGPEVKLEAEKPLPEPAPQKTLRVRDPALNRYIDHYFAKPVADEPVGEHTMFIRQAYAHVEKKQKKKFGVVIAGLVVLILAAGLLAWFEHNQLLQQRATAEELFYAIKAQDVDLANLDRALANSNNPAGAEDSPSSVPAGRRWKRTTTSTWRRCISITPSSPRNSG